VATRFRVTTLYVHISACSKCASNSNSSSSNRGSGDSSSNVFVSEIPIVQIGLKHWHVVDFSVCYLCGTYL